MSGEAALEGFYEALLDDDAEALYERAPCGYLSTTPDGMIIKVNETFLAQTGFRRDDLLGRRTFAELLTAGGRIYHETHYAPMLRMQDRVREIALDVVGADGQRHAVLVNSVLERDAEGRPFVIRTAVFDATERREYERELLRSKQRAEESEAHAQLLARTLQQTLIPPALPDVLGLDLAAVYRPAGGGDEIGGDFYDVFEIADGDWVVVVGDVCGKGVDAAVVTAVARHTIRAAAVRLSSPRKILEQLNEVLLREDSERFCTVALMRLRRADDTWAATVALAGHPQPVLRRAGRGPASIGLPGTALGLVDAVEVHDVDVVLVRGDAVVLYTDGVTEGRRGRELFGEARLELAISIHGAPARALADGILADVLSFQGDDPRDDIVVLVVGVPGPRSPNGSAGPG